MTIALRSLNPNLHRHLKYPVHAMRDQHHPALGLVHRLRERIDSLHVKMIGWFVVDGNARGVTAGLHE